MIQTVTEYPNGGKVDVHALVDREGSDYKSILACCEHFARQDGAKTLITPRFGETVGNPKYEKIYASLEGTPFWGKCPDFKVDEQWYEHEGYDKSIIFADHKKRANKFRKMITRGVKQSDKIIVEDTGVWRHWAKRNIFNRVHTDNQHITEVYIRTDDGLELIYKK